MYHIYPTIAVAVGMPVTRHPPHRSRRAELPHRAPASGQTQSCCPNMDQISSIVHRHSIRSPLLCLGRLNTSSILRTLAFIATRSTLLLASVCQSRPVAMNSPWPRAFSPRTPPVVGWNNPVEHHCSLASSILCPRPTSRSRAC